MAEVLRDFISKRKARVGASKTSALNDAEAMIKRGVIPSRVGDFVPNSIIVTAYSLGSEAELKKIAEELGLDWEQL